MRTWCVSLTMHGTSKLIIHNFIYPVFVLESGKSLRHLRISVLCVPHTSMAGMSPGLRLFPFPYMQVSTQKLGLIHISRSECCANSVSLKGHFSFFLKKCLQHGFQSIFSIKHENIDEWGIITKAVYLYIALYNMSVGTASLSKAHARKVTRF